jgi:hypothetical protein
LYTFSVSLGNNAKRGPRLCCSSQGSPSPCGYSVPSRSFCSWLTLRACSPSLVNCSRKFIPDVAHLLLPLTGALHGGKRAKLVSTKEMSGAFDCPQSRGCCRQPF